MQIKKIVAAALVLVGTAVSAAPSATGYITPGSTFGSDNSFVFTNTSTLGENILSLELDLTPINAFFDSAVGGGGPGSDFSPLRTPTGSVVGHVFPTNASFDETSFLKITFTDFNPGETFRFGVDTDFFGFRDRVGDVAGEAFGGALIKATFSDGTVLSAPYVARNLATIGSDVALTVTPVPEPSAYALMGVSLLALGAVARRRRNGQPKS